MQHQIFGKKLNRDTGQRQALLRGLAGALIRSEAIETTQAKAVAAKSLIEKLITQAKRGKLNDIRQIETVIPDKLLVSKLVNDLAPKFKSRAGGYLRLVKMGNRIGDNAPMVRIELVMDKLQPIVEDISKKTSQTKKSASKIQSSSKKK